MKKPLVSLLVILAFTTRLIASWAAHLVISPDCLGKDRKTSPSSRFVDQAARLAHDVSISEAGPSKLKIVLVLPEKETDSSKGHYLVVGKSRFPTTNLNFRPLLRLRGSGSYHMGGTATVSDIRPLEPSKRNGTNVIEVILDRDEAKRSYIAWDFKTIYERGGFVIDGGLWLTYDIPAFVEAYEKATPIRSR